MRQSKLSVAAVAAVAGLAVSAPALAQLSTWAAAVDGNWNDPTKWDNGNVPDNGGEQAKLPFNSAYTVTINLFATVGGLTITDTKANLDIAPGQYLLPVGDITNNGTIRINPTKSGNDAHIRFDASANLNGSGSVVLFCDQSDLNDAQLYTNGTTITQGASHSIRGTGNVSASLVNNGTVRADSAGEVLLISSAPKTNNNLFAASNGGILSIGNFVLTQGANGVIRAQNGSTVSFNSTSVGGGKIDAVGSGTVTVSGVTTFMSVTNSAPVSVLPGSYILVTGSGLTNNAIITVNPTQDGNDARIRYDNDGALDGTGEILLQASVNDLNDAQLITNGTTITQAAAHTIRGTGYIGAGLINNGTVRADSAGEVLRLNSGGKTNNKLFAASNGGILGMDGLTVTQGANGVIRADDASTVSLTSMTLVGGTVDSAGSGVTTVDGVSSFNGVTNSAAIGVNAGAFIIALNGLTNNGVITVNPAKSGNDAHIRFDTDGTLGGTGEVLLQANQNDLFDAQLITNGTTITQGPDHLVHGTGYIGAGLINNGTVLADSSGEALRLSSGGKTNNNLFAATGGGILGIDSVAVTQGQDGVILAEDTSLVALASMTLIGGTLDTKGSGLITVDGISTFNTVTNQGDLDVNPGAYILAVSDITNNGIITINPNKSANDARIRFDAPGTLSGAGQVILSSGDDLGDAQLISNGAAVTIGADQTVRGRGLLNGNPLTNLGTLSPGEQSIGFFQVNGNITLGDSSKYDVEAAGPNAGQFDAINVSGTATLGGALNVALIDGYIPDTCTLIPVVTAASIQGAFDSVSGDAGNGRVWRVVYSATQAKAIVTCYADMNPDCKLDLFDFLAFVNLFNAGDPVTDCTHDGTLDLFDFLCFVNAFNHGC